jgi:hypothetical protein
MSYIIGTTVTIQVTFKNTSGTLNDVTTLKYRPYLYKNDPLAVETVLTPADKKISTGVYQFDYTIPSDINTEVSKQLTLIVTATVDSRVKVGAVTLDIDWT